MTGQPIPAIGEDHATPLFNAPEIYNGAGATTMSEIDGSPFEPIGSPVWQASVVPVFAKFLIGGASPEYIGTAFHIGKGWYVTAGHVLMRWVGGNRHDWQSAVVVTANGEYSLAPDDWYYLEPYHKLADDSCDLALFKAAPASSNVQMLVAPTLQQSAGWVLGRHHGAGHSTALRSAYGAFKRTPDEFYYDHMASTIPGESGGPLIVKTSAGVRCVGVHVRSVPNSNRAIALKPDFVQFALSLS